ncbi:MAG: hypothetical protein HC797_09605 [Anaerolineales bacterium]|nr:hypothetical protein [Anaerolineales bacterium]
MSMVLIVVIGSVVVLISVVILALVFMKANQVNLTGKTDDKPEWMRTTPPDETLAATQQDGEGVTLYDFDEGEALAAPFAEQIEDILRVKLESDPVLKEFNVDLGTASDGGLDIWVNGEKFSSVDELPNEQLKQALQQAIKDWNHKK